ncbi:S8 family serine peptidase [Clostridium tagluense]|uniref:S8 family serine peptidase n=1 Tax=Clostridium tagluense TaxID=360422 RepID=UPI001CF26F12|nr:S8 family serine peptidase [Clostridium tagluense]MCB2299045.1 S8 family serine peptidase [Clostridium tagluense]
MEDDDLLNDIGYINNTGTSMAAPYITGTIARINKAHSNWGFDEIKAAITNNANILKDEHNISKPKIIYSHENILQWS